MGIAVRFLVAGLMLSSAAGCDLFKSEKKKVEEAVIDGLKEKTGKTPDSVQVQTSGGGNYTGTAALGADIWDVTATVSSTEIRWEAKERVTLEKVKQTMKDVIRQESGKEAENIMLTEQGKDKYTGTATIGGQPHDVTATVVGINIQCEWRPRMR